MNDSVEKISFKGLFIWSLAVLFFFYEFFLRIVLGTLANEVRTSLALTLEEFSVVAAAYYIVYGVMQIPVGIITEKLGARLTLVFACFICTTGVFVFSIAQGFVLALVSRLLIGFGSSFAFIALLILALNWFPKRIFGFFCGIALFLGAVGPILAGAPLAFLLEVLGGKWRVVLLWFGGFGAVLTCMLALFLQNKPPKKDSQILFITPHIPTYKKLFALAKIGQAWWIVLTTGFLYCSLPILAAYFGTSYMQARGLEKTEAAFLISMVWVGYAVGNPLVGKGSDLLKRRIPFVVLLSLLGCAAGLLLLYFPNNHKFFLLCLFLLIGFASSAQGLAYALMIEHTPKKLHSAALGFTNAGGMVMAAVVPLLAGSLIQTSTENHGLLTPNIQDYSAGLVLIPLAYAVTSLLSFCFIKETYCRSQHEIHFLKPQHKASDLL